MAYTISFFGTKPYDEASFNDKNKEYGFELRYYKGHLNKHNVILTQNLLYRIARRCAKPFAQKKGGGSARRLRLYILPLWR